MGSVGEGYKPRQRVPPHCYLHYRLNYRSSASGPYQYDTCHKARCQASEAWSADPKLSDYSSSPSNRPHRMQGQNPTADTQSTQQQPQSVATQPTRVDPKGGEDCNTQLNIEQTPETPTRQTEPINAEQQVCPPQQETQASVQAGKPTGAPPQVSRLSVGQPDGAVNKEAAIASAAASAEAGAKSPLTGSGHTAEQPDNLLNLTMAKGTGRVNSSTSAHPSLAEAPTHNLKISAFTLASDPVSNISLLSGLQSTLESTETGRHQLQTLAIYMAGVAPSTIVYHNSTNIRLDRDALHAMVANARNSQHSSHHESTEQSRIGLAVLLLGVWADKLPARLASAHAKVPEAAEDADRSSDQQVAVEVSAVPALINALPTAAAGALTKAFSSGAPASASGSASESASESINHDEMSPWSPCSAITVAASQPLPCSADHMSMMASDLEEEEEDKQQETSGTAESTGNTAALRGYQQEALERINQGGNHIVVAPTGSGKTRIAVEVAGQLLQRKPQAKVVFLATTVALAQQQAGVFKNTDCIRQQCARVQCSTGSARITEQRWRIAIFADSVLVMTAQQLLNMLGHGVAALQQIDLLILDECHHCVKDAPYNHIMQIYKTLSEEDQAKTQVLGLTASPGGDADEAGAVRAQWTLQQNMSAEYVRIDPKKPEVRKLVPRASDHIERVDPRQEDVCFATAVAHVVLRHVESLTAGMKEKLAGLDFPALKVRTDLAAGRWSPELKCWFRSLLDKKQQFPALFVSYVELLRDCNSAAFLAVEYGFEMALHCLGHSCTTACDRSHREVAATVNSKQTQAGDVLQALLWDLAAPVCNMSRVSKALMAAHDSAVVNFPKFRSLVEILESMIHSKETFHGIVFVRRRHGVHAIANMLSKQPSLAAVVTLHTFTGHSSKTKAQLAREGGETAGMPIRTQQEAMVKFDRGSGREVMVATAAFQEGLDICNCSFVVCYNVTERGVQLMQWRGRTRKFDSQIFILVEAGSQDEAMLGKSIAEEKNDHLAQIQLAS